MQYTLTSLSRIREHRILSRYQCRHVILPVTELHRHFRGPWPAIRVLLACGFVGMQGTILVAWINTVLSACQSKSQKGQKRGGEQEEGGPLRLRVRDIFAGDRGRSRLLGIGLLAWRIEAKPRLESLHSA